MHSTSVLAVLTLTLVAACGDDGPDFIECRDNVSCDRFDGGECRVNPATGNQFCAYPAEDCESGMRWSDLDVEESISGDCVEPLAIDAGIDGEIVDAMPDGAPPDGPPQGQAYAIGFGGSSTDLAQGYATYAGDAIVGGLITGTANLGGGDRTGPAFVARYNSEGLHRWSVAFGAAHVRAVATDNAGNVIIAGEFSGSFTWPGTSITRTSAGGTDVFVAKLDAATGDRVWDVTHGGTGEESVRDLAVTSDGDAVVTGNFSGSASFGGTTFTATTSPDVFVGRYDSTNGAHVWSRAFAGNGGDTPFGIAVASNDDVIVGGSFSGTITPGASGLLSAGSQDMFLVRLAAADGTTSWAQRYGSTGFDQIRAVAVTGSDVYIAGNFDTNFAFGPSSMTVAGIWDVFVGRVSAATGVATWGADFGGTDLDQAFGVAVASGGDILVTGKFGGTVSFGSDSLTAAGNQDVFLVRISAAGAAVDAVRFGGDGVDVGNRVRDSGGGFVDIAGEFSLEVDFTTTTLTSNGATDFFVKRLSF